MSQTATDFKTNGVPPYDMSDNPTGCCPRFHPDAWDNRLLHFENKLFVRVKTRSLMYVPLNMGRVFKRTFEAIEHAGAQDPNQTIVLSRELSPWSAEHFFAVTREVPDEKMVQLSGDYRTKVFEGPFKDAPKWHKELAEISSEKGKASPEDIFLFYTSCPKCAKHYGKNYVVGLAPI